MQEGPGERSPGPFFALSAQELKTQIGHFEVRGKRVDESDAAEFAVGLEVFGDEGGTSCAPGSSPHECIEEWNLMGLMRSHCLG